MTKLVFFLRSFFSSKNMRTISNNRQRRQWNIHKQSFPKNNPNISTQINLKMPFYPNFTVLFRFPFSYQTVRHSDTQSHVISPPQITLHMWLLLKEKRTACFFLLSKTPEQSSLSLKIASSDEHIRHNNRSRAYWGALHLCQFILLPSSSSHHPHFAFISLFLSTIHYYYHYECVYRQNNSVLCSPFFSTTASISWKNKYTKKSSSNPPHDASSPTSLVRLKATNINCYTFFSLLIFSTEQSRERTHKKIRCCYSFSSLCSCYVLMSQDWLYS